MKTFIIENKEKERIKFLYESKGIILNEDGIWGDVSRVARRLIGQNEDDIARALRSSEVGILKSLDDIILQATKNKNITPLNDLQAKVMHFYNPSGSAEGATAAQEQVKKFLNGYAKAKGKLNWKVVKDEVSGIPQPSSSAASKTVNNIMSGQRVSNRWYAWKPEHIDFTKFSNPQTTFDELNKSISNAIKTGQWNLVPRAGFEKFGIPNFREFLQKNIAKVNEVDPSTGRWSVIFK